MDLAAMLEALNDPQMKHAALVHMPIVLSIVGAGLALLSALFMARNTTLRWLAFGVFALVIVTGKMAENSGQEAQGALSGMFAATEAVASAIHEHEEMAEKVWFMAIATTVLLGGSLLKKKPLRITCAWLAVGMGGFTAMWVGSTAHHGGTLIYAHGAGAPANRAVETGDAVAPGDEENTDDAATDGEAERVDDPRLVHFRENVKPVIEEHCIKCHNPTRKRRVAGLDQTTMTGLLEGGMSGPAIVPGNPEESWFIIAVRHEQDYEMPPNKDKLPDEVIAALEQWVRDGAVWEPLGPAPEEPHEPDGESDEESTPAGQ